MSEMHGLPNFLLTPAERALNTALAADPVALSMLAELDGRRIAVEMSDFSLALIVGIVGDRLTLATARAGAEPDATVSGTLASLLRAGRSGSARGLNVAGDAELVQGIARVMGRLPQATWERIASAIGDLPARGIERFARASREAFEETRARFAASLGEYLQYELRAVAARPDIEEFLAEVDRLRADADRLAKRVERLRE
ncbi:MAG: ubiquinone biosynthesis accessory factor UbiJ [Gammaproteobacteria bacterium]